MSSVVFFESKLAHRHAQTLSQRPEMARMRDSLGVLPRPDLALTDADQIGEVLLRKAPSLAEVDQLHILHCNSGGFLLQYSGGLLHWSHQLKSPCTARTARGVAETYKED